MKLLSIAIATTLTFAAATSMAKTVVLKPLNENLETAACYTAATQGIKVAKTLLREKNVNFGVFKNTVTCNGMNIIDFAHKYGKQQEQTASTVELIALVAKNTNVESQLCLDAVTMGEHAARAKHNIKVQVLCNYRELSDFVRLFEKQEVVVHNFAE